MILGFWFQRLQRLGFKEKEVEGIQNEDRKNSQKDQSSLSSFLFGSIF